ncbi:hypothetical protein BA6E_121224 [Bacteroidales bacterium 6E]|nr:hypothetical protein BA6E_121224 [Bacteroidales bacterium 6E]
MKTIILSICILISALNLHAQDLFGSLTGKYANQEGFSATHLTNDLFDLYLKKKQVEPGSAVYETLKKLNRITVISQNSFGAQENQGKMKETLSAVQDEIMNYYKDPAFSLLKTENRMGEVIKVYLKKNGDKVNTLSMVSSSPTRLTMVELSGDIDLTRVSDISGALNVRGLENLNKINGTSNTFVFQGVDMNQLEDQRIFWEQYSDNLKDLPYPQMNIEMLRRQKELTEKHNEMTEKHREIVIKQQELANKYGRQPIFLSTPGDTNVVYYINDKKVDSEKFKSINPEDIESVSVIKAEQGKKNKKSEIRIITRKK